MSKSKQMSFKKRLIFTVVLLLLYRLCSHIPLPFVDSDYVKALIGMNGSLGLLNTLTGGNLANMSIVALGITPYITASIVLQLMGVLIPSLAEMQRDGSTGQEKFKRINIVLAVILGLLQSGAMMYGYGESGILKPYTWYSVLIPTVIMTVSVFALSFIGQYITDHLFGNGVSLLLVTGILCSYLSDGQVLYSVLTHKYKLQYQIIACTIAVLIIIVLFAFTVWLNTCEKKIRVNNSAKVSMGCAKSVSVIPLKLIGGSVVPVIFASTILTVPSYIQLFGKVNAKWFDIFNTSCWLKPDEWWASAGVGIYFLMIIGFSYYYQSLNLNEREIADNLKRSGSSIIGVRPGHDTEAYLHKNMKCMTFLGGIGLCIVAFIPIVLSVTVGVTNLSFAGTSIIIVVAVVEETYRKYQTEKYGHVYRTGKFGRKNRRKRVSQL